jgi:copper chaperone CopZ
MQSLKLTPRSLAFAVLTIGLMASTAATAQTAAPAAPTTAASSATGKTVKMTVDGMVCSFCAQGIESRLKQQAATDKVLVSLDEKLVALTLKDGKTISDDKLRAELKDAGYEVKTITRSNESLDSLRKPKKS